MDKEERSALQRRNERHWRNAIHLIKEAGFELQPKNENDPYAPPAYKGTSDDMERLKSRMRTWSGFRAWCTEAYGGQDYMKADECAKLIVKELDDGNWIARPV